jgi:hypothetical protein|tara:strand:+ start:607 stop:750 length:144 start_codon:yes stop_codon:yes gene_type:complete
MVRKRFDKKGQEGALSYRYLLKILLVIAVAAVLYLMLRSITYGLLPK